jgi:hypothetical protein
MSPKMCEHLYSVAGQHDRPRSCFACCWRDLEATLSLHSLLDCKRLEFTDSSFCVLAHLYERSIGATVVEEAREEHEV